MSLLGYHPNERLSPMVFPWGCIPLFFEQAETLSWSFALAAAFGLRYFRDSGAKAEDRLRRTLWPSCRPLLLPGCYASWLHPDPTWWMGAVRDRAVL